ncbi:MAG: OmpA/MotB domain protein [Deltaproteobacteria bacterium]|jgi:outer membrane protein OmpA-like peptidoglycan-associated protein|nr:OmpA/MotB domain protein [Deltaproteobacteria bacterium]
MGKRAALAMALSVWICGTSHAGWFEDAVKGALEGTGKRAVDETTDSTYQGAKGKAKESVKEGTPGQNADAETPAQQVPPGQKPAPGTAGAQAGDAGGGQDIAALEQIYSKYDFVPGDKVIFFDDFSDTDVGEFPRKWTLKGPGAGTSNAVEVVQSQGRNFLRSQPAASKDDSQYYSRQYVRLDTKGDLPQKFTVEFDAVFAYCPPGAKSSQTEYVLLLANDDTPVHGGTAALGSILVRPEEGSSKNTRTAIRKGDGKVHHIAVSVNGTFVKAYVDHDRVANDPDGIARPVKHVGIFMGPTGNWLCPNVMFTNFRLAEGGKDIKSALSTDGKIVTHGILFDTGKDVIKPESLPTLKMILGLLEGDPSLKFSIEGHTDNQGGKGINQPLSERRAAAVKAWLEGKGIAADRLQSKGWGDTKPIDTNDTPEGRANNRRVEFVKIP